MSSRRGLYRPSGLCRPDAERGLIGEFAGREALLKRWRIEAQKRIHLTVRIHWSPI
jgi:hypothetical protein